MSDIGPVILTTPALHAGLETDFPQLWHDVNSPVKIVYSWAQVEELGAARKPVPLSAEQLTALADALGRPSVPPVYINPQAATLGAAGGGGSFNVTMRYPGQWTAVVDPAATWITIDSPSGPQTADGQVAYTAAPNLAEARAGTITVNDQVFTVSQPAGPGT